MSLLCRLFCRHFNLPQFSWHIHSGCPSYSFPLTHVSYPFILLKSLRFKTISSLVLLNFDSSLLLVWFPTLPDSLTCPLVAHNHYDTLIVHLCQCLRRVYYLFSVLHCSFRFTHKQVFIKQWSKDHVIVPILWIILKWTIVLRKIMQKIPTKAKENSTLCIWLLLCSLLSPWNQ